MLSINFFSSKYILEKEVQNALEMINAGENKEILCVIVSDFLGIDKLGNAINSQNSVGIEDSILKLNEYQYLPYGTIRNEVANNNEEIIIPLKRYQNIEKAYTQITEKILNLLK